MKRIFSLLLLVTLCLSLGACNVPKDDGKIEWEAAFELGSINANGKRIASASSIRTKKAIPCDGLSVLLDADTDAEYRIFFYDRSGNFVKHTAAMTGRSDAEIPSSVAYAQILLTPFDKNGKPLDSIDPLDVVDYGETLTVRIDPKQRYNPNLIELAKENTYTGTAAVSELTPQQIVEYSYYENTAIINSSKSDEVLKLAKSNGYKTYVLDCSDVASFVLTPTEGGADGFYCSFWTYDGSFVETGSYADKYINGNSEQLLTVKEEACYAIFHLADYKDFDLSVYQYR